MIFLLRLFRLYKVPNIDLIIYLKGLVRTGLSDKELKKVTTSSQLFMGARGDHSANFVNWLLVKFKHKPSLMNAPLSFMAFETSSTTIGNIVLYKIQDDVGSLDDLEYDGIHQLYRVGIAVSRIGQMYQVIHLNDDNIVDVINLHSTDIIKRWNHGRQLQQHI